MAIRSHLKSLEPTRKRFAKEITLLSHGFSSPKAFPSGKITVYPWDLVLQEKLLDRRSVDATSNTEKILSELLPFMCNLNGARPDDFYVSELKLILMVSYAQGQGGNLTLNHTCPKCGKRDRTCIVVPDNLEKLGEKSADWTGFDSVKLPETGDIVELRPLKVADLKSIWARTDEMRQVVSDDVFRFCLHIHTVGTDKDNKGKPDSFIEAAQYVNALSIQDVSALTKAIKEFSPRLKESVTIKCDKCSHEYEHALTLDFEFFL